MRSLCSIRRAIAANPSLASGSAQEAIVRESVRVASSAATVAAGSSMPRDRIEKAPAGARLHAADEKGVTIKAIASAIGDHLRIPVVSVTPEEGAVRFGGLAGMLQLDVPASSDITRQLLGWEPTGPGILADLRDDRLYRE